MDNALIHLSAAVEKVGRWEPPMRLNDTTRTYFEKLAGMSTPDRAARYRALFDAKTAGAAQAWLRVNDPGRYSMLRTSVVPTMLTAGVGANVIPSEAEATLVSMRMGNFFPRRRRSWAAAWAWASSARCSRER